MHSEYLHGMLGEKHCRKHLIQMARQIQRSGVKFDAIAFTGNSGALLAAPLAFVLKKPLILVRKNNNNCHSTSMVEGCEKKNCRYIIVDDSIYSGDTIKHLRQQIRHNWKDNIAYPKCVALFLHSGSVYNLRWKVRFYEFDFPVYCRSLKQPICPPKMQNKLVRA